MKPLNLIIIAYLGSAFYMGYAGAKEMWNVGTEGAMMVGGLGVIASLPALGLIYFGFLIVNWLTK